VGVTAVSVGGAEASKIAEVMRRVREGVPSLLATFGIKELRPKRMANGGTLLEIPGAMAASQADALARHIRDRFPEGSGVKVTRPIRRVDLRLTGFDESLTPEEIATAVSGYGGGCDADQVRVGRIRTSRRGDSCTVWVQAPATVGVPLSEEGRITLGGWVWARVALLKGRPLRCYRLPQAMSRSGARVLWTGPAIVLIAANLAIWQKPAATGHTARPALIVAEGRITGLEVQVARRLIPGVDRRHSKPHKFVLGGGGRRRVRCREYAGVCGRGSLAGLLPAQPARQKGSRGTAVDP